MTCFLLSIAPASAQDSVSTVEFSASADLTVGGNYTPSGVPGGTSDILWSGGNSPYATTAFNMDTEGGNNGDVPLGTLNDADTTQALTLDDTSGGAYTLTFSTAANNTVTTGAASASDLLFVASGANLNIGSGSNVNEAALTLEFAVSGNIDNAGTLTIGANAPIQIDSSQTLTFTGNGNTTINSAFVDTGSAMTVNVGTGSGDAQRRERRRRVYDHANCGHLESPAAPGRWSTIPSGVAINGGTLSNTSRRGDHLQRIGHPSPATSRSERLGRQVRAT